MLLKITILDEQEPSLKSSDRTRAVQFWSWGNMHKLAHPDPYLKINIAFHAIKNPKQQSYLQVVTCGDASFMEKKRIYLYDHAA